MTDWTPTIYLCGAINGCSDDEATTWREHVKRRLGSSYKFLDPMRRDYRGDEDANVTKIISLDTADIVRSDVILVNAEKPSWGTAMEVRIAYDMRKKILIIHPGENVSPWLRYHADAIRPSIESAIRTLEMALV